MSEKIDWSKAPADATHCWAQAKDFFKLDHGNWMVWFGDEMRWAKSTIAERWGGLVERPTTPSWSGEGLPPVGVVCERRFIDIEDEKWSLMEVLCHGKTTIYYRDRNGTEWSHYINDLEFRPIRTPEQIAADEREAAIKEMTANYAKNSDTLAGWAAYVYDTLGYRKEQK